MSAEKSLGTSLEKVKSGSESTNLVISGIENIGEFGEEVEEIDVTTLDSGEYREFIPGLSDSGELPVTVTAKDNETVQDAIAGLVQSKAVESWIWTAVSGAKYEFDAFVKSYKEGESAVDGKRTFSFTLRLTGSITFTPSTEISA